MKRRYPSLRRGYLLFIKWISWITHRILVLIGIIAYVRICTVHSKSCEDYIMTEDTNINNTPSSNFNREKYFISNTSENEWYLSLDSQIPWMKSIFSSHRRENIDFMNGIWLFKLRYHEFSDVLFLCTLTQHRHPGYLLFRSGYLLLCSGYLLFSNRQGGYLLFSHCRTMLQQVYRNVSLQHGPAAWSLKKIASWV